MNIAIGYSWIKALHVAAAITFVGAVLAQSFFLAAVRTDAPLEMIRRFGSVERRIATPALIVLLASGIAIATLGSWLPQRWLILKLILVVALLGIHGLQSGQLRRLSAGQAIAPRALHHVVLSLVTVIAGLAVLKPALF